MPPHQLAAQPPHSGPLLVLCPPLIISHHGSQSHLPSSGPCPVSPLLQRPHLSHRKSQSPKPVPLKLSVGQRIIFPPSGQKSLLLWKKINKNELVEMFKKKGIQSSNRSHVQMSL